jgi:hypothetical protein
MPKPLSFIVALVQRCGRLHRHGGAGRGADEGRAVTGSRTGRLQASEDVHQDRADRVVAKIIIRNVGHLPARNVRFYGDAGSSGQADDFPTKEPFPGKIVLAPGADSTQVVATIFGHQVGNSTYVWGMVTYDDGFGNNRCTRFCHRYPTKAYVQQRVELPGAAAEIHQFGNDAN